jgi:hypothetical protein
MMCPANNNPVGCEIHAAIRFLHTKNTSSVKIRCELWAVYGQNVMSEGSVRQWCRMSKDGQTHVHNERRSG